MEKEKLHDMLSELHSELESIKTVDEGSRALLVNLKDDIEGLLDRSSPPSGVERPSGTVRDRISAAVEQFEASHPRVTSLLSQISYVLSQMGI